VDLATFLVQCLNSVQYGLLLFLLASGLTLIFGIMGVINLAHGSFYMIGAYAAFSLAPYLGQHFIIMLLVGVVLAQREAVLRRVAADAASHKDFASRIRRFFGGK
jgi:branched-chain amino acid transport system permease protein